MEIYFIIYFAVISLVSCVVAIVDKIRAARSKRRVSEKTLLILALLGGSMFMYITMKVIRHKTRKNKFMVGLPLIFMSQVTVLFFGFQFLSQLF